ncbi:MAG: VOC family protein [Armatimonadota bacterium]
MIKTKRLNAMNLKVRDLAASARWYGEHFGLEPQYAVDGGVVYANDTIELVLSPHDNPDAPLADPRMVRCIHTLGIEVSQDEFPHARAEFDDDLEIVEFDQPEFRSFITVDPDGYCVEIFYNKWKR